MTMQNINGVVEAQDALGTVADNVRARAQELSNQLNQAAERANNVQIGARAALQGINDHVGVLSEEATQLHNVLGTTTTPPTTDGNGNANGPYDGAHDHVDGNGQPGGNATATANGGNQTVIIGQGMTANPRQWGGIAWLLAFIGAVVGIFVFNWTLESAGSNIGGDFSWAFTLAYFVAVVGIGFFGGGTLGSYFETRQTPPNNTP